MLTQPIRTHAPQQANTTDTGTGGDDQLDIQLVTLANGNLVALWTSNTDTGAGSPNGTDVIGQFFDPLGNRIGTEFLANLNLSADFEGSPVAAALPNGNFVLVFQDNDANGASLRYRIVRPNGTDVSSGTIAPDPGAGDIGGASLAANSDGSVLVAYQERNTGNRTETRAVFVGSNGNVGFSQNVSNSISTDVGIQGQQTDVAALTNGNYVVVDHEIGLPTPGFPNGDSNIRMRIVTAAGVVVTGSNSVVAGTDANFVDDSMPTVAALANGGYVIAWKSGNDIAFQRYTASGQEAGPRSALYGDGLSHNTSTPTAVGLSDGSFIIGYDDNQANSIAMQHFDAGGIKIGSEIVVATGGNIVQPELTLSPDGRLLVGWTSITGSGSTLDYDVQFANYTFHHQTRDFNGDGGGDFLWRNDNGAVTTWSMNNTQADSFNFGQVDVSWKIAGSGDFNGDAKGDILWRNDNGAVVTWNMTNHTYDGFNFGNVDVSWKIAGTGDFNGDGRDDIVWRNDNGAVVTWNMNNHAYDSFNFGQVDNAWKIAGTGDFNGDGRSDILWRNSTTGDVVTWDMNNHTYTGFNFGQVDLSWKIAGTGDFNGDGRDDILWRNDNGQVVTWNMNDHSYVGFNFGNVDNSWKIASTGNYNGDGKSDILWRNDNGGVVTWDMNDHTYTTVNHGAVVNAWHLTA